jgi:hypothetical protein
MDVAVQIDTANFEAANAKLLTLAREHSVPEVADVHKKSILSLTAQGLDAHGIPFHDYNLQYAFYGRIKQDFTTSPKDLRKTKGRLYNIQLDDMLLTVEDEDNARVIAAGQMSGAGGRWAYVHDFLDASDDANEVAAVTLAEYLQVNLF